MTGIKNLEQKRAEARKLEHVAGALALLLSELSAQSTPRAWEVVLGYAKQDAEQLAEGLRMLLHSLAVEESTETDS